jgi:hypothetical protein
MMLGLDSFYCKGWCTPCTRFNKKYFAYKKKKLLSSSNCLLPTFKHFFFLHILQYIILYSRIITTQINKTLKDERVSIISTVFHKLKSFKQIFKIQIFKFPSIEKKWKGKDNIAVNLFKLAKHNCKVNSWVRFCIK